MGQHRNPYPFHAPRVVPAWQVPAPVRAPRPRVALVPWWRRLLRL